MHYADEQKYFTQLFTKTWDCWSGPSKEIQATGTDFWVGTLKEEGRRSDTSFNRILPLAQIHSCTETDRQTQANKSNDLYIEGKFDIIDQWWWQKPFCLRSSNHPLLTHCKNSCNHMGFVRLSKKRFKSAVSRCSVSSRKHPILTDSKDWCFNWKPRFLIIRGLSVSKSICSARFCSTSADYILYN